MLVFTILFQNVLLAGLGYGTQVIVTLLNFYYIIVLAWGIFYLSFSFSWDLAWSSCNNTWNTGDSITQKTTTVFENPDFFNPLLFRKLCGISEGKHFTQPLNQPKRHLSCHRVLGVSSCRVHASLGPTRRHGVNICVFWCLCRRRVLRISSGIDHMGSLNWDLALCLFIAWVICYFCIWKGTKSTGKVGVRGHHESASLQKSYRCAQCTKKYGNVLSGNLFFVIFHNFKMFFPFQMTD